MGLLNGYEWKGGAYTYFSCTKMLYVSKCAAHTLWRVINGEIYAHVYTLHLEGNKRKCSFVDCTNRSLCKSASNCFLLLCSVIQVTVIRHIKGSGFSLQVAEGQSQRKGKGEGKRQ